MLTKTKRFNKKNKKDLYIILGALIILILLVIPSLFYNGYKLFLIKIISYKITTFYSGYLALILIFAYLFLRLYKKFIKGQSAQQINILEGTISELQKKIKFYEEQLTILKNHFDGNQNS